MPNSKKKRTAKHSPNTAGDQRQMRQEGAACDNREIIAAGGRTPWMIAKDKRRHLRILAGKPTQWMRKQQSASNYKTTGPNAT